MWQFTFFQNIEKWKTYNLVLYIRSLGPVNMSVSLTDNIGMQILATTNIIETNVSNWTKIVAKLEAKGSNSNARLQLKTNKKGVMWLDQVSLMPTHTYKGHGFRNDLFKMVADMKPGFIRFPGEYLRNAFRWKETIGAWEERPGHFGDVWFYWTDDGLGHYEFFQCIKFRKALDGIEFARGGPNSTWGSIRAAMGHPEPFDLKYVAIGNEDCGKKYYRENYLKFYAAIRKAYPDIKMISNCDGSNVKLDHPADMYDFHIYSDARTVFSMANTFDRTSRVGPKYAVTGDDAGLGSLLASLAEAGFLIGLEKNSDIVEMASYAPLFVNTNDKRWKPDAIVFDSSQSYGTPSYWMQHFFKHSNGATLLKSTLQANSSYSLEASAIVFQDPVDKKTYLRVKVVNFGSSTVNLKILIDGLDPNLLDTSGSKTVLSSANVKDENSFANPEKITPVTSMLEKAGRNMDVVLLPHSLTCFDVVTKSDIAEITTTTDVSTM
ncbi:hypothetical protein L1987_20319 [Smallanthus sonchifolius]|uniref:Uncharacterized protein n=1 Tax=Smallanthus sonchifolius TaxID=185202 RepID=A0ACB9IRH7_9ASTR|nr:hypothetical protein L1987_20319 [Smallanthus sonchifolius]